MLNVSWEMFDKAVYNLYDKIKKDNITFDGVYGIPRGGVILAVALSHKLKIPYINNIEKVTPDTLIVDDISDTGNTLKTFKEKNPDNKIAAMYSTPNTIVKPDYYIYVKFDKDWLLFPWEDYNEEIKNEN